MLWAIAFVLFAIWAIGVVSSNTLGGLIHLLFAAGLVVLLARLTQARKPKPRV